MNLPDDVITRLQPLFPGLNLGTMQVELRVPQRLGCVFCPLAWIKAGGSPWPGLIEINPPYWKPTTLEGLKLIAHELYHQAQQKIPGFDALYDAIAMELEARGLPSWFHPLEAPAYEFERALPYLLGERYVY